MAHPVLGSLHHNYVVQHNFVSDEAGKSQHEAIILVTLKLVLPTMCTERASWVGLKHAH